MQRTVFGEAFDRGDFVALNGDSKGWSEPGEDVSAFAEAGATWWLENVHGARFDADTAIARIADGPPRA